MVYIGTLDAKYNLGYFKSTLCGYTKRAIIPEVPFSLISSPPVLTIINPVVVEVTLLSPEDVDIEESINTYTLCVEITNGTLERDIEMVLSCKYATLTENITRVV